MGEDRKSVELDAFLLADEKPAAAPMITSEASFSASAPKRRSSTGGVSLGGPAAVKLFGTIDVSIRFAIDDRYALGKFSTFARPRCRFSFASSLIPVMLHPPHNNDRRPPPPVNGRLFKDSEAKETFSAPMIAKLAKPALPTAPKPSTLAPARMPSGKLKVLAAHAHHLTFNP
jgi:hypothetical protein